LTHAPTSMPVSASDMAAHSKPVAVLFDALGTLLTFEPPAPHLREALRRRTGVDVGEQGAEDAIRAEIAYYRAHLHEGRDPESLLDLRIRCAEAMELPFSTPVVLDALLASLRFFAYPDSARALRVLRAAGIRTAVVSNWDVSLHERLQETGLAGLVDGALASAEVGAAKPDGAIFRAALELVGARPEQAWHVGDTPEADVVGARAAGLRALLIARDGAPGADVRSLDELIPLALPR
jgi:putative hydrolase of the HAD superfamily